MSLRKLLNPRYLESPGNPCLELPLRVILRRNPVHMLNTLLRITPQRILREIRIVQIPQLIVRTNSLGILLQLRNQLMHASRRNCKVRLVGVHEYPASPEHGVSVFQGIREHVAASLLADICEE